jgi:hypothetical protein
MTRSALLLTTAACAAFLLPGCASTAPSGSGFRNPTTFGAGFAVRPFGLPEAIQTPALVGVTQSGVLKYFPMSAHGGSKPIQIGKVSGMNVAAAMAANGSELTILNQGPPGVYVYDLSTKRKKVLQDPFGSPVDVAIDKKGNRFVLNFAGSNTGNIAMYAAAASKAKELNCRYLGNGQAIAVDNEGDIFVNEYRGTFVGVVEIPNGAKGPQPQNCSKLALIPESKYATGIGVDPKTDDLIVIDDPGNCNGGPDGRMTIYPKPYRKSTGHAVALQGSCVGLFRLDSKSSTLFAFDQDATHGTTSIIQRSFPVGKVLGSYENGDFYGITTLPNTLPN